MSWVYRRPAQAQHRQRRRFVGPIVPEPVFNVEQATESDIAAEVTLAIEQAFALESAVEIDTADDIALSTEPVISVEQSTESDVAADVVLAVEPAINIEQADESDVAQDITLSPEPVVVIEQASEVDTATDVTLTAEPVVALEQGTESDVAQDVTIAPEPSLAVENASESDIATDSVFAPDVVLSIENATESDVAGDVTFTTEPVLPIEQASEVDTAIDVVLAAEPLVTLEEANESDVAAEIELETGVFEPIFSVEQAFEGDTANEIVFAAEPALAIESPSESDHATIVTLAAILDPGTPDYISTPHDTDYNVGSRLELIFHGVADDWTLLATDAQGLMSKQQGSIGSWRWFIVDDGRLQFIWYSGGGINAAASPGPLPFVDGEFGGIKTTFVSAGGDTEIKHYTRTDPLAAWDLFHTFNEGSEKPIDNTTDQVDVGANQDGISDSGFGGAVLLAQMRDDIDGTLLTEFNPADFNVGDGDTDTAVDSLGKTWTLHGATISIGFTPGQEIQLRPEPAWVLESTSETDTAADIAFSVEPVISLEQASESDVAGEITMEVDSAEPTFNLEQAMESDVAAELVLVVEPSFTLETSTESDVALEIILSTDFPSVVFTYFQPADHPFDAIAEGDRRARATPTDDPAEGKLSTGIAAATLDPAT